MLVLQFQCGFISLLPPNSCNTLRRVWWLRLCVGHLLKHCCHQVVLYSCRVFLDTFKQTILNRIKHYFALVQTVMYKKHENGTHTTWDQISFEHFQCHIRNYRRWYRPNLLSTSRSYTTHSSNCVWFQSLFKHDGL